MAFSALSFLERCFMEEEKHMSQAEVHLRWLLVEIDEVKGRKRMKEFVLGAERESVFLVCYYFS